MQSLTSVIAESAVRPVAEIPGRVADRAAQGTNWNLFLFIPLAVGIAYFLILGTGARQAFAPRALADAFGARGIGIEAMDSRAAART